MIADAKTAPDFRNIRLASVYANGHSQVSKQTTQPDPIKLDLARSNLPFWRSVACPDNILRGTVLRVKET
jgi:hypothetical protein